MKDINSASSALLHYLDDLLLDTDHVVSERIDEAVAPTGGENENRVSKPDSNSNILNLILFKVANVPLALPRAIVRVVVEVSRGNLPPVESIEGMIIRKFNYQGQDIQVLDAKDIVLPCGHPARQGNDNERNAHILVLKDVKFGLLCDQVGEYVDVDRMNVEWRLQRSSRPWLAGMV